MSIEDIERLAATCAGFLALEFVAQAETWPVFTAWVATQSQIPLIASREHALVLVGSLQARMIEEARS